MQYLVVIEKGVSSYGAYVPDLPECIAVGETRQEVSRLIHEALEFHLGGYLKTVSQFLRRPVKLSWWMSPHN